jgi:osmotically-inducible protein OsmY
MIVPIRAFGLALVLTSCLSGCAEFKCAPESCSGDARITADVSAVFSKHAEFVPPGTVRVQTINGIVYLNGQVNSEMERRSAEALVRQVANVKDVVNSLDARSNAR